MALFPTATTMVACLNFSLGKASIAWLISSVAPAGKIPRGAVRSKEDLVQTKIIQTEF